MFHVLLFAFLGKLLLKWVGWVYNWGLGGNPFLYLSAIPREYFSLGLDCYELQAHFKLILLYISLYG